MVKPMGQNTIVQCVNEKTGCISSTYAVPVDQRYKLVGGPYTPPHTEMGGSLTDERHGLVKVGGYSDAPISWPTMREHHIRGGTIILCPPLVDAVQRESVTAICFWWGVSRSAVQRWKRALSCRGRTEGSQRLYQIVVDAVASDKDLQARKSWAPVYRTHGHLEHLRNIQRLRWPNPA